MAQRPCVVSTRGTFMHWRIGPTGHMCDRLSFSEGVIITIIIAGHQLPSWSTSRLRQQGMLHLHLSSSTTAFLAYQTTAEERLSQGVPKDMFKGAVSGVNTIVHEGRGLNMTLDAHSFELVHQKTVFLTNTPRKSQRSTMLRWLRLFSKSTGHRHFVVFLLDCTCSRRTCLVLSCLVIIIKPFWLKSSSCVSSGCERCRVYLKPVFLVNGVELVLSQFCSR